MNKKTYIGTKPGDKNNKTLEFIYFNVIGD